MPLAFHISRFLIILLFIFLLSLSNDHYPRSVKSRVLAQSQQRDIILILTDDQPYDTMQFMPLTQELLAHQGVNFNHVYNSSPICVPSRVSLLTGQNVHSHGVVACTLPRGGVVQFNDSSTLATWLQDAGYRTALVGKYINEYEYLTPYIPPGWDQWFAFANSGLEGDDFYQDYILNENGIEKIFQGDSSETYSTNVLKERAIDFIRETPPQQPLFLLFSTSAPHVEILSDPEDAGKFADLELYRPPSFNESDVTDKPAWVRRQPLLSGKAQEDLTELYRLQARSLQSVDRSVAAIVQTLEETGRLSNAVIIYSTDNGLSMGEHRWSPKRCVYESCSRVPLLIRASGVQTRTEEQVVSNVDLTATILEFAGLSTLSGLDSLSLVELLYNPMALHRQDVLIELLDQPFETKMNFQAVHTGEYVYTEYDNGDQEFYDLTVDPFQLANAVGDPDYQTLVSQMRERLEQLQGGTDLVLSARVSNLFPDQGEWVTIMVKVTNNGPQNAYMAVVRYVVPPEMRFITCQSNEIALCEGAYGREIRIRMLKSQETTEVKIILEASQKKTAVFSADLNTFTPNELIPDNNEMSIKFNENLRYLSIVKNR